MRIVTLMLLFAAIAAVVHHHAVRADEPAANEKDRFDLLVREDLFAGFNGDEKALARGLKVCNDTLAKNPKHAQALVWRGAAMVYQAGQAFQNKKPGEGFPLWTNGLKDMDEAVKLEPNNVGVRIPRASVLMPAARNAPPAMGQPLLKKALEDFELIYKLQAKDLAKLGTHPRGELRMGLADVYRLMKDNDKSKEQLEAVIKELPDTKYAKRATEWLAAKPDAKLEHNCIGCHKKQ
jgi:tetratricopeptide (TPR) repeat protein